jgi:hypothetical protein
MTKCMKKGGKVKGEPDADDKKPKKMAAGGAAKVRKGFPMTKKK